MNPLSGSQSGPWARVRVRVAALVAGLVAVPVAVLFDGSRVFTCWTGIGPAPEPQTSECVSRIVAAMTPWDRLQYDQPILGVALFGLVVFVAVFAAILGSVIVVNRIASR